MNSRSRVDAALALVAVLFTLAVAIFGGEDGAAWLRWVAFTVAAAVLLKLLRSAAVGSRSSAGAVAVDAPGFEPAIDREVKRCRRSGRPMSVVLCEIDSLPTIVSEHGPQAGESADHQLGDLLRSSAREIDLVARVGDGRYGILLPETPDRNAAVVAERLLIAIARWSPQSGVPMTASFGVAGWAEDLDVLDEARGALVEAQQQGSDRVVVAGGDDLAS